MPSSIMNKIKRSCSTDEFSRFVEKCRKRPDAPDESCHFSFIDDVIGPIHTRDELAKKIPVVPGAFRLYKARTHLFAKRNQRVHREQ